MKLAIWALAAALLVPSLAAADRDHRAQRKAQILERFDANHDGQLDDQERGALKAQRRAKLAQRFDTNGDGQLDRREKREAKVALRAQRMEKRARRFQRLIDRFDRDHDGSLGPGEVPPKAMHKLRKLDRDGDGWVRPNEMRTPPARDRMRDAPPPSQAPAADEY